jgi:hypothetical protein
VVPSACTVVVEACMDMGAGWRNTWDYWNDRDGVRNDAAGASAEGSIRRTDGFLKVWSADSDLCNCLY